MFLSISAMSQRLQSTSLHRSFGQAFDRLQFWAMNPWRRYSLLLIIFLTGFFLGTSIGTINGVLALMDPIGAFFTVFILEILVRLRRNRSMKNGNSISINIIDAGRMGLLYGLLMEGFKLL